MTDGNHVNPTSQPRSTVATSRPQSREFSTNVALAEVFVSYSAFADSRLECFLYLANPCSTALTNPLLYPEFSWIPFIQKTSQEPHCTSLNHTVTTITTDCLEDTGRSLQVVIHTPTTSLPLWISREGSCPYLFPRYGTQVGSTNCWGPLGKDILFFLQQSQILPV